ncbi:MAG: hypothetical protein DRP58_11900 [Spirochaetes bacterium]|nr:MAG: hypothetical protein DRP58_11900 [Spirochaetota bacterium]
MKALPIGISTLSTIIQEEMVYIDKTEHAYALIEKSGRYFLSRPRRFGKSLFLDTLKEIFEGNEELFRGLYIHDKWDWAKKYPVIKIDFAGGTIRSRQDLDNKFEAFFNRYSRIYQFSFKNTGIANRFNELIEAIIEKTDSRIVILVDEYDKPLLDNIENSDLASEIREELKNFYSVIKERDAGIRFVFLTGVSKFAKVNIFSGINNLRDITLDEALATVCGYTQKDLETSFKEHLEGVDWKELKKWYNGYSFLGERVYNPYDVLLFIANKHSYRNYWFETGTPTFLIKLFRKNNYFLPDLDNLTAGEELLSSFEIDQIDVVTLLFQSGYLTIKKTFTEMGELLFQLTYPNIEVKRSLNKHLISGYTTLTQEKLQYERNFYKALETGDLPSLEKGLKRLFAGIPWRNFTNNDLVESEGYYASVLYAFFAAINCTIIPEDITNHGQSDITVILGQNIYVMEIKLLPRGENPADSAKAALSQIKERGYTEKYLNRENMAVYEAGLIFCREERNLVGFIWEKR